MAVGAFKTKLFFNKLSGATGAPAPERQGKLEESAPPSGIT